MNLRCMYCQTPFTVGRLEKLAALQKMQAENLHHYDVHCPRCRRANPVPRQKLEMFTPGWQEGLKGLEQEAAQVEKEMASKAQAIEAAQNASAVVAEHKPASKPEAAAKKPAPVEKKALAKPVPTAKPKAESKPKAAAKKPAAKKPAPKATKPAVKKPAVKPKGKK